MPWHGQASRLPLDVMHEAWFVYMLQNVLSALQTQPAAEATGHVRAPTSRGSSWRRLGVSPAMPCGLPSAGCAFELFWRW